MTQNKLAISLALIITAFIVSLFLSATCNAATLATMTSVSTSTVGQTFTVDVYAVPQGKNDTGYLVQAILEYKDAKFISWKSNDEFLEVKTKKYWKQNHMYVMRTLGFPGGFTKTKKLGTATFEATKEGSVGVGLVDGFVLNAKGENTFTF